MQKRRILPNIIIGIAAVVAVFPIVFIFANSFMGGGDCQPVFGRGDGV